MILINNFIYTIENSNLLQANMNYYYINNIFLHPESFHLNVEIILYSLR